MRVVAFGTSVTGPQHRESGEPNQDAMVLTGWRGGWLACVADGLGSRPRSQVGSRRACQVTRQTLRATDATDHMTESLHAIHRKWISAIAPIAPDDAATTLLFARVNAEGVVHAAQLGDGLLLMRTGGSFTRITPERPAYGNQTWALGTEHRPERWHRGGGTLSNEGDGVVLMSDGVADDLEPDRLSDFVCALYADLARRSRRYGRRWLRREFNDWPTPMHGDDKTLVAVFRTRK